MQPSPPKSPSTTVNVPDRPLARGLVAAGRGALRRCPYCGGKGIFSNWFVLKDTCPRCRTTFAREDGYFLGSYPVNLVLTSLLAIALMFVLFGATDTTVLEKQIAAVVVTIALPLLLYPYSLSIWMALDLTFHAPHHPERAHYSRR